MDADKGSSIGIKDPRKGSFALPVSKFRRGNYILVFDNYFSRVGLEKKTKAERSKAKSMFEVSTGYALLKRNYYDSSEIFTSRSFRLRLSLLLLFFLKYKNRDYGNRPEAHSPLRKRRWQTINEFAFLDYYVNILSTFKRPSKKEGKTFLFFLSIPLGNRIKKFA